MEQQQASPAPAELNSIAVESSSQETTAPTESEAVCAEGTKELQNTEGQQTTAAMEETDKSKNTLSPTSSTPYFLNSFPEIETFYIQCSRNGFVLDVKGAVKKPETYVIVWKYLEKALNQQWKYNPSSQTIHSMLDPTLVLDVKNNYLIINNKKPNAKTQQWQFVDKHIVNLGMQDRNVLSIEKNERGAYVILLSSGEKNLRRKGSIHASDILFMKKEQVQLEQKKQRSMSMSGSVQVQQSSPSSTTTSSPSTPTPTLPAGSPESNMDQEWFLCAFSDAASLKRQRYVMANKLFTLTHSKNITNNESKKLLYQVEGELLGLSSKMQLKNDKGDKVIAELAGEMKLSHMLYNVKYHEQPFVTGKKMGVKDDLIFELFNPKLQLHQYEMQGDALGHFFYVNKDQKTIAVIIRQFMNIVTTYLLDMDMGLSQEEEIFVISCAMIVDRIYHEGTII